MTSHPIRMRDVADSLGVSVATISLALRGSPLVAKETRDSVRREASRLSYVYNRRAANLRRSTSELVGFVVPDIRNEFAAEAALGLQEVFESAGLFVTLANTLDDVNRQTEVLQALREQRARGVVLIPAIGTTAADVELDGLPLVLMNRTVDGTHISYVGVDEYAVVEVALDHLINGHGLRSLAYFGGIALASARIARLHAFRQIAAQHSVDIVEPWSMSTPRTADLAHQAALSLLDSTLLPQGVLCHSDEIAWGVLRALHERGIGPEDCRVIGIDDLPVSKIFTPSLTSVALQPRSLGREAGRALAHPDIEYPRPAPALNIRESCGPHPD